MLNKISKNQKEKEEEEEENNLKNKEEIEKLSIDILNLENYEKIFNLETRIAEQIFQNFREWITKPRKDVNEYVYKKGKIVFKYKRQISNFYNFVLNDFKIKIENEPEKYLDFVYPFFDLINNLHYNLYDDSDFFWNYLNKKVIDKKEEEEILKELNLEGNLLDYTKKIKNYWTNIVFNKNDFCWLFSDLDKNLIDYFKNYYEFIKEKPIEKLEKMHLFDLNKNLVKILNSDKKKFYKANKDFEKEKRNKIFNQSVLISTFLYKGKKRKNGKEIYDFFKSNQIEPLKYLKEKFAFKTPHLQYISFINDLGIILDNKILKKFYNN